MATQAYETPEDTPIWELECPERVSFSEFEDAGYDKSYMIELAGEERGEACINSWGSYTEVALDRPGYWNDDISDPEERKAEFKDIFKGIFTLLATPARSHQP